MTQNIVNLGLRMTDSEAKKQLLKMYDEKGGVIVVDDSGINTKYVLGNGDEFIEISNLEHNILVAAIAEREGN